MAFSARPPISSVATDVPGYKDGYYDGSDRPNRESYYVTSEASPEPGDEWTRPDLTDEQLAELNPRTRSSIEHSRRVEASKGGRPAIGPRVHVALPAELLAMVDRDAERTGFSRAEVIRRAVAIAFRACDQKNLTRIIDEADVRGWTHSSHSDLARFIITELADEA